MNRLASLAFAAAALVCTVSPLSAQQKRVSPPDVATTKVDDGYVSVYYGRPFTKDPKTGEARKVWGELVPYGKVWRLGANEATLLVTQKPIVFGETTVPAGAYSLFMLPMEDGSAKLIINKQLGQWGAYTYDEKQDLARIDLKKDTVTEPVDPFTIALDKSGTMSFAWADHKYSTTFSGKK